MSCARTTVLWFTSSWMKITALQTKSNRQGFRGRAGSPTETPSSSPRFGGLFVEEFISILVIRGRWFRLTAKS
ncbi:MAG: hypothetical protein JXA21_05480 [Anaerolineae bacterium]|nr:hypothetical protein [Anaerolineae bacterium]